MTVGTAVRVVAPSVGAGGVVGPSVPAQVDPSLITDTPGLVQGAVSFLLVLVAGWVVLARSPRRVEDAVDALFDEPGRAILYGAMAYVIVLVVGLYGVTQAARLAVGGGLVAAVAVTAIGVAVLVLTGFGFLVLGTLLTDIQSHQRPQYGLVVGAVISGVVWLVLPLPWSAIVWFAFAAFGIGGATRLWLHTDRTVERELRS